jgi:hypothetical protein
MSAFCHVDDAYNLINKEDVDLDKLAREVNDQKKRKAQDIYRNYRADQSTLSRGVAAYNNLQRGGHDKGTDIPHITNGFFSAQGDYSDLTTMYDNQYDNQNDTGLLITDIIDKKKQEPKRRLRVKRKKNPKTKNDILKDMVKHTYYNSVDDMQGYPEGRSDLEISSISDSMSELSDISFLDDVSNDTLISRTYTDSHSKPLSKLKPKKSKKSEQITLEDIYREIKLGSKYTQRADEVAKNARKKKHKRCIDYDIKSADSLGSLESGESLLEHINDCSRCRDHVVGLIRKSRETKKSDLMGKIVESMGSRDITEGTVDNDHSDKLDISEEKDMGFELKEILTVCLIGFLVIIILDLTINYRSRF